MSRKKFVENVVVWCPQVPKDVNGLTLGGNYQYACMKHFGHATVCWLLGNLAADGTLSITQAKNIGGSGSKAYTIDTIYKMQTTAGDAKDQTRFIEEAVAATSRTVKNTSPAEDNYLFCVEIEAEQLDVANGFDCIRPEFVGGSGASLLAMFVIFSNPRFLGRLDDPRQNMSPLAGEQETLV